MNSFISKKVGEIEENSIDDNSSLILLNKEYNDKLFKEAFQDEKNKLTILCVLSKIVYKYNDLNYLEPIIKEWNIKYIIDKLQDVVYGIFYTDDYVVVSFKGTTTFKETLSNINFIKVDDKYSIPGKIHRGFHDLILENNVAETLELKINEIISPGSHRDVYITGHSLGGALATVFYSYLQNSPLSNKGRLDKDVSLELITYGSPRVGDYFFSKAINDKTKRVVNGNDIVTKVPVFCYNHYEKLYHIGSKFSINLISDHFLSNYYKKLIK